MDQSTLSQLAQAISDLSSAVTDIRSDVSSLRSEVQLLKAQGISHASFEPRPAPITPFSGNPKLGKGFLAQCEVAFSLQPSRFVSDSARIGFVASALTSRALEWYTATATRTPSVCLSYNLFREQFLSVFCLPEDGEDAAIRLSRLNQGDRSVADYAVDFQVLAAQCSITDDSKRGSFYAGLNQCIREGLINQYPKTFSELIQLAIRVDARHSDLAVSKPRVRSGSFLPTFSAPPESMELGGSRVLSERERRERFEKGLCLYCGQAGHARDSCPKLSNKKKGQTHYVERS